MFEIMKISAFETQYEMHPKSLDFISCFTLVYTSVFLWKDSRELYGQL